MVDILVVDDDPASRELIQFVLERMGGHSVRLANSAAAALTEVAALEPDLLVLDVVMPGMSGLELCRRLRRGGTLPILLLSGLSATDDRVAGLRAGADDYVPKPFDPAELLERVNALLRRARRTQSGQTGTLLHAGELRLHLIDRCAWVRDRGPIQLTPIECRLLFVMMAEPNAVWSREDLLRRLWEVPGARDESSPSGAAPAAAAPARDGAESDVGTATAIETYVSRLRKKIEPVPHRPRYLLTVRGHGYRLRTVAGAA